MNTHFNLYYLFRKDQQAHAMPDKFVRKLQKMLKRRIIQPCGAKMTVLQLCKRKNKR